MGYSPSTISVHKCEIWANSSSDTRVEGTTETIGTRFRTQTKTLNWGIGKCLGDREDWKRIGKWRTILSVILLL